MRVSQNNYSINGTFDYKQLLNKTLKEENQQFAFSLFAYNRIEFDWILSFHKFNGFFNLKEFNQPNF
jgi:hypothetical protein